MTSVAGWITAISVLVIAVVMTVGLAVAVVMIRKSIRKLIEAANPAMKRAEATLTVVEGIAENVRTRTEEISQTVEDAVEDVSRKVKSTTSVIEDSVRPNLVSAASLLAGFSRGLQTWSERKKGGNSHGE
jgi:uncharacterized protein YoxC